MVTAIGRKRADTLDVMHSLIVHVSDPSGFDEQITVQIEDGMGLGEALHHAFDELAERNGSPLTFPVFVDVHPTVNFDSHSWMYQQKSLGARR